MWGLQVTNGLRSVSGRAGVTGTGRDKLWEAQRCLQPCQELAGTPGQDALAMRKVTQETLRFPERWQGMTKSVLYELRCTKRKAFCQLQLLTE